MATQAPVADYHDRKVWLEERKKSVGGSEVAAIFGEHPFITPQQLWERKTGRAGEQEATLVMEKGRVLEPAAVERYELRTGRKTRRVPLKRRDDFPYLHASADRQVFAGTGEGEWHTEDTLVLEAKVLGYHVFQQVREKGIRPYMILQGQAESLVFGYPRVSFGILHADSFRDLAFDMESDVDTQEMIGNEVCEWWEKYVVKDIPPPEPDYGDLNLPEVEGELAQINDPEWEQTAAEWIEAKAILDQAQAIEKPLRAKLKELHKEYGVRAAQGAGVRAYLIRSNGRRSYKKELDALAQVGPLDPDTAEEVVRQTLGPTEEGAHLAQKVIDQLLQEARLEFPEIVGDPFYTFKPYALKGAE